MNTHSFYNNISSNNYSVGLVMCNEIAGGLSFRYFILRRNVWWNSKSNQVPRKTTILIHLLHVCRVCLCVFERRKSFPQLRLLCHIFTPLTLGPRCSCSATCIVMNCLCIMDFKFELKSFTAWGKVCVWVWCSEKRCHNYVFLCNLSRTAYLSRATKLNFHTVCIWVCGLQVLWLRLSKI